MQQVMEGNIAAAAGLLVGANMMTRGLLMKGTGGFLKFSGKKSADVAKKVWVWDKRKGKKGAEKNNDEDSSENTPNELDKKDKENKKQSLKERAADAEMREALAWTAWCSPRGTALWRRWGGAGRWILYTIPR